MDSDTRRRGEQGGGWSTIADYCVQVSLQMTRFYLFIYQLYQVGVNASPYLHKDI